MVRQFVRDRLQNAKRNIAVDWMSLKEIGFVAAAILVLGLFVSASVSLAAFYGVLTIVMGENPTPSATESIGLALLSAALAAVVLLLVKPRRDLARRGVSSYGRLHEIADLTTLLPNSACVRRNVDVPVATA